MLEMSSYFLISKSLLLSRLAFFVCETFKCASFNFEITFFLKICHHLVEFENPSL